MSNEIMKVSGAPAVRTMDDLERLSTLFAKSGLFKDTRDAAQCGIRILAGLELGFGAFTSMSGVHIIQGKPTYSANLIAATVKRSGRYTYRVKEHTDSKCYLTFHERDGTRWEQIGVSEFTIEDAKKANLLSNATWRNYPRNMLFSRALTNGVRWHCPDVFGFAVYSPDELGADVDGDGNVIDAEVKPVQEPAKAEEAPKAPKTITKDRAEALGKELEKLGYDTSNEAQLLEEAFGLSALEHFTDLTDGEAVVLWKTLKKKATEAAKEPWEKWQDDNDAIAYGSQSGVFKSGADVMTAWEAVKNRDVIKAGTAGDPYQAWFDEIQSRLETDRQNHSPPEPQAVVN